MGINTKERVPKRSTHRKATSFSIDWSNLYLSTDLRMNIKRTQKKIRDRLEDKRCF